MVSRACQRQLLAACLLLIWLAPSVPAQSDPAGGASLKQIEHSIEQGRLAEIERPLLDYAVAHPKDVRALELLGRVRHRQGRLEEAQALFQRVLTLDPASVGAKLNLAHVMHELGRREEARQLLNEIELVPVAAAPELRLSLVKALLLIGEPRQALAAADKLPNRVKTVQALPVIAASHLASGERQRLTALIPQMKKTAVANPVVAAQCAEVLQKAGMVQQAVGLLRLALGTAPNHAGVLVSLGRLETEARDFAPARRHLNRALALVPRSADVFSALAALENAEGNTIAALESVSQARSMAPDSAPIMAQFVLTAMRAGRPQAAVEAATALLKLQPDEAESLYLFGAASLHSGKLAAAQNALARYVQQRPDDPRGCLALGLALAGQRDQPAATKSRFARCLHLDPANVEAKYQLSLLHKEEGKADEAIRLLEDVTARAPRHA
ncbi:MAG: tetratricopeptide repeat protein, partial [Pyrinomonadaceae bacterium]